MSLELIVVPPEPLEAADSLEEAYEIALERPPRRRDERVARFAAAATALEGVVDVTVEAARVLFWMVPGEWEELVPVLTRLAHEHGLAVYDPQADELSFPGDPIDLGGDEPAGDFELLVVPPDVARDFGTVYGLWRELAEASATSDALAPLVEAVATTCGLRPRRSDATHALYEIPFDDFDRVAASVAAIAREYGLVAYDPQRPHDDAVV